MIPIRMAVMATMVSVVACGAPQDAAEELHDEHADNAQVVSLTPQQMSSAQIALGPVVRRAVGSEVEATAQIEAAADRIAHVGPIVRGRIVSISARTGDAVAAGQSLATMDAPELSRANANYVSALASATLARQVADKERALFERGISSEREWRNAEADALRTEAEKQAALNELKTMGVADTAVSSLQTSDVYPSTFRLSSPIAGQVVEQHGAMGQVVDAGFAIFTVMDLSQVWVVVDVYEQDLGRIATGHAVQVRMASYPGRIFRGVVDNVGATLETATRTVKVRVVLSNPDLSLKPGMFASVTLSGEGGGSSQQSLVIPASAVQRDAADMIVFVSLGGARFESRPVAIGRSGPNWIEVLSGLQAGDSVVITGAFLLKSQLRKSQLGESHPH